jgi:peptidoglycan biosynthesis protein MviN/MurJ (putative lipid II flippase)
VLARWLIMGGTWVRVVAEAAFYGLYSRHKDKSIWMGNIIFLVVSFLLNLIFVPLLGLTGLGLSSLLANAALLLLRVGGLRPLAP